LEELGLELRRLLEILVSCSQHPFQERIVSQVSEKAAREPGGVTRSAQAVQSVKHGSGVKLYVARRQYRGNGGLQNKFVNTVPISEARDMTST
jgi:hypothetical protein